MLKNHLYNLLQILFIYLNTEIENYKLFTFDFK